MLTGTVVDVETCGTEQPLDWPTVRSQLDVLHEKSKRLFFLVGSVVQDWAMNGFQPRKELGRKLLALRRAYVKKGGQLLDGEGLERELRLRRGGVPNA